MGTPGVAVNTSLGFEPGLDVNSAEPEVPTNTNPEGAGRSSVVALRIQAGYRNAEPLGNVASTEEPRHCAGSGSIHGGLPSSVEGIVLQFAADRNI